jgi:hypothetical protein
MALINVLRNRAKTAWFNAVAACRDSNRIYYTDPSNLGHLKRDAILSLKSRGWEVKIEGGRVWVKTRQMIRWQCVSRDWRIALQEKKDRGHLSFHNENDTRFSIPFHHDEAQSISDSMIVKSEQFGFPSMYQDLRCPIHQ